MTVHITCLHTYMQTQKAGWLWVRLIMCMFVALIGCVYIFMSFSACLRPKELVSSLYVGGVWGLLCLLRKLNRLILFSLIYRSNSHVWDSELALEDYKQGERDSPKQRWLSLLLLKKATGKPWTNRSLYMFWCLFFCFFFYSDNLEIQKGLLMQPCSKKST